MAVTGQLLTFLVWRQNNDSEVKESLHHWTPRISLTPESPQLLISASQLQNCPIEFSCPIAFFNGIEKLYEHINRYMHTHYYTQINKEQETFDAIEIFLHIYVQQNWSVAIDNERGGQLPADEWGRCCRWWLGWLKWPSLLCHDLVFWWVFTWQPIITL